MKYNNLGGHPNIRSYVSAKLKTLENMEHSFATLFNLMFSEKDNIIYEESKGYKIVKTTYGQCQEKIYGYASSMSKKLHAINKGTVIGLYMNNGIKWIEAFWAILLSGYCPLLLNSRLDDSALEEALKCANADAVISDGKSFSLPTFSIDDFCTEETSSEFAFGDKIIVMSSGTSSHVKLCFYTAEEFFYLIKDSYGIIKANPDVEKHYEGELKLLTFLPFYHIFGLVAVYIWFAFFSRTFVHLPDLAPQTILGTIRKHKVTHIFAVPLFWEKVYDEAIKTIKGRGEETYARFEKGMRIASLLGDIPGLGTFFSKKAFKEVRENLFGESISFMITGGSEIKTEVLRFFNAIGYPLANGFGMTEIGITSVELSTKFSVRSAGFVGKPLSSVEYKISENGELLVKGKSLAALIIEGDIVRQKECGWFHTGDMAEEVNGHYRVLGRRDDLVIGSSGENLNPNLIEPKISVDGVKRLCLIRDDKGEAVLIASVGRHLSSDSIERIKTDLRGQISALGLSSQLRKTILVENELMGEQEFKLNRRRISKDYSAGIFKEAVAVSAVEGEPDDSEYLRVVELFALALGKSAQSITKESDFFLDEGGSSLDYFVLISALKEEYGVDVSSVEGVSLTTPASLYNYIKGGG